MRFILRYSLLLLLFSVGITLFSETRVVLGSSAPYRGSSKELGINFLMGANLYFQNDNRYKLITYDDEYNPETTFKNTIKLVEEDDVDLLFNYVGTPTTNAILPLLKLYEERDIILFGNLSGAGTQRSIPYLEYVFNIRPSYEEETMALVKYFLKQGKKRIGIFYQIDDFGKSAYNGVIKELQKNSLEIISETTYRRGALWNDSMKKQVEYLKSDKPDVIISVATYEAAAAFIRDSREAGLNVPIANLSFVGLEYLVSLLRMNMVNIDELYCSEVVPYYENFDLPIVREYNSHFEAGKGKAAPNFISFEGFINAKILGTILDNTEYEINRGNIKKIIEEMDSIDIGLGIPLKFSKENHQLLDKIYLMKVIEGGVLVEVN